MFNLINGCVRNVSVGLKLHSLTSRSISSGLLIDSTFFSSPSSIAPHRFYSRAGDARLTPSQLADQAATLQQELEEHEASGNDLFSILEAISSARELGAVSAEPRLDASPSALLEDDDIDVILEGLPRVDQRGRIDERQDRLSIPQISALSFALGLAGAFRSRVHALLLSADAWVSDDRWLPPFYRAAISHAFHLDLDQALLGKAAPEAWKFQLLDAWLGEQLGWQRVVDPKAAGASFGYLFLPFSAFDALPGALIGLPPSAEDCPPSPQAVAARLAHGYLAGERLHRAVAYSPASAAGGACSPATAWVREGGWQRAVVRNFFGAAWLGYALEERGGGEEVLVRASAEAMDEYAHRLLDSLEAGASSSRDVLRALPQLPLRAPLGVALTRESLAGGGDSGRGRDLSALCHQDVWALSRLLAWMKHVRSHAVNLRGAAPLRLQGGATVFAIEIGRVEEQWQRTLATRWLRDMLGWSLQLNGAEEASYAYFSSDLLTANAEHFVSVPPDSLTFSQLTPDRLAWITIQRELKQEIHRLSSFIDSGAFASMADAHYNFQSPISKWMRPIVSAFFDRFLGYTIIWRSTRKVSLYPNATAIQEAIEVLAGRKQLRDAFEKMGDQARIDPQAELSDSETDPPNV